MARNSELNTILTCMFVFGTLIEVMKVAGDSCYLATGGCPNPNVTFWLRTREQPDGLQLMYDTIDAAPLKDDASLVVLVHGYTGHKLYSPNMELVPVYLNHGGYNVISVDWGPMAKSGCYIQAAFNVDLAGRCIASFLKEFFRRRGEHWKAKTHIVGFSLGAHVSGVLGNNLKGLPRITGLDPALPLFSPITCRPEFRLDEGDANFVDVYHTNAGWKGRLTPLGHVDFYVNNGAIQSGCYANTSCDHVRAVEVFSETIHTPIGIFGRPCVVNVPAFLTGLIQEVCPFDQNVTGVEILAGEYINYGAKGTYKIETNLRPPFAKGRKYHDYGFYNPQNNNIL